MEENKELSAEVERKPQPKEEPASSKKIKAGRESRTDSHDKIEKMKERDYKLVRGIFKRMRNSHVPFKFYFKKYKGRVLEYTLKDGHVYEIPYMVAKHLHDNCYVAVHQNATDEEGNRIDIIGKKIKEFDFISPDILIEPDNDKSIVTVQRGF